MAKVSDRQEREAGFTMVELIAILALVSLLAFMAAPRFPGGGMDVSSQAEQLAADIRYAQTLSMTRGDRYGINLTTAGYQITDSAGNPQTHPGTGSTSAVTLDGVALSGYNPPLTGDSVFFDGRGVPYVDTAGTALSANAVITLTGQGAIRIVTISPETGRVAVQ